MSVKGKFYALVGASLAVVLSFWIWTLKVNLRSLGEGAASANARAAFERTLSNFRAQFKTATSAPSASASSTVILELKEKVKEYASGSAR